MQLENYPRWRIEVRPTTLTMIDLQFQSLHAMVVTHTHAKDQGQRSVGSKDKVETDGRTDGRRRLHYLPC